MKSKVILILVDGMRPDGIAQCGEPYLQLLAQRGASTFAARTTMPSVTLPCHASLFFSTTPARHGITTNIWMPLVRPIDSLTDAVAKQGGRCACFYNWEQLRDLAQPGMLISSTYINLHAFPDSDRALTERAIALLRDEQPDFTFLYLGETDEVGHKYGWMTPEYENAVANASRCIRDVVESLPEGYSVLVTADHGGHERGHGLDIPEDMTIPLIAYGAAFAPGSALEDACITDIAPTVAALMGIPCPRDWEGRSLLKAEASK